MRKLFFPALLLGALAFTSCSDDDDIIVPVFNVEAEGFGSIENLSMAQEDTLSLKVNVENLEKYTVSWKVNGEDVATGTSYDFVAKDMGKSMISATVIAESANPSSIAMEVEVYGKYKHGTFVLSEGNFGSENGRLAFISPKGIVTDSAYYKVNSSFIGNTAQDLFISDNKMYIISQNGDVLGGDGMLVVANAETLKKEAAYNEELEAMAKTWPTHVAVVGNQVYIRDNKGVSLFNTDSKELTFVEGTAGAIKNRMAVIGTKVYAIVGSNVVVIENGTVSNTIKIGSKISGIQKTDDNNLWVSCDTKPAQMCKVSTTDYSVMQKNEISESGMGAGWGATPAFSAKGDTIYFSNASTKIYRHIFSQKSTEYMVNVVEQVPDAKMAYNNLAVHPETGDVYFTSIKGYGNDYLINDISVFDFDSTPSLKADYKGNVSFPAGVFFTASFK